MTQHAVAFFTDRAMLPGLHAALVSLLNSNANLDADTFVFTDSLAKKDCERIAQTWALHLRNRPVTIREFSPTAIGNRLHGNSTAYGRLYLGELLPDYRKCIYLDSDVVVNVSLAPLFELLTDDTLLAADCVERRHSSLDKKLFIDAGIDIDGPCFNSGVLAMNLDNWRITSAMERCRDVSKQFAGRFASADQALLNVAFHDQVIGFGEVFNSPLWPAGYTPSPLDHRIYHFVGAPKPWDLFGATLHNSYSIWRSFYEKSAIGGTSTLRYLSVRRIVRTSRQVMKAWIKRRTRR